MGILRDEVRKLSGTLRQRTMEPKMDEEIRFHIDMQTEKNIRLGMSPEEARRAALVRFGGTERIKEEARDEYRSRPLEDLVQDVRYGVRSALRKPLFTLLAVLTLTLGIPLLRGRTFGPADRPGAPKAIVISESMAKKYWPGGPEQAVGAHLRLGPDPESPWSVVIGVVGDVRNDPALVEAEPMSYASMRQEPWGDNFLLRTNGDPLALVPAFRRELAAVDPEVPIGRAETLRAYLAEGMAGRRLPVLLMTAFGALALLLASVGVYALFTSMVAARERELGLRIVLGSPRRAVAGLVLRGGAAWMAAGLAAGAVGVVVVARLLRNLLFGVPPFDPVALGASLLTLLACASVALLVPVRRATRVDPITVIRE
ncbi:MAG TPA: permease prefix domain 1-containing protein [Thermoanaerobaculia bacterium]|jgi:hypothetical protein